MATVMRRLKNKEHTIAHVLRKRCIKKNFEGIHDRFQKESRFRDSQLRMDRTEEVCIQMDKDAQKDFIYRMSQDEYFRYKKIGGSLSTHLDKMHRWNYDQVSAKHWQNCPVFTVSLEKSDLHPLHSGSTRHGVVFFKWHDSWWSS